MPQIPETQPSGSAVSNVESDITQTIGLGGTIYTLIREPVVLAYGNVARAQKLKKSFGFWQEEASATDGRHGIPSLRLKEFEKYLVEKDGVLQPALPASEAGSSGTMAIFTSWTKRPNPLGFPPAGSASWTYLLFALGICPGMGVVTWRLTTDGFVNTQDGSIVMEVEGSVLCHIINLFSVTLDQEPWQSRVRTLPNRRLERRCEFPFGELAWTMTGNSYHAHFKPGPIDDMLSEKCPFGSNGKRMNLQGGTTMALYFTALVHGVSDSEYQLAGADKTLRERITKFVACFHLLLKRFTKEPLLISYDWFESAARVKRRALAQGGHNHSFYEDACEAIDNEPRLSDDHGFTIYRELLKKWVREYFLLDDETFTFLAGGGFREPDLSSAKNYLWSEGLTPISFLIATLSHYEHEPSGSWKRGLFDMKSDIQKILVISNNVDVKRYNLQLIEFTPRCDIWEEKVSLGAPISA